MTMATPFVRCLLPRPPPRSSSSSAAAQTAKDSASSAANACKRSRLVLLQHTAGLTTRLTASSPADATRSTCSGGGSRGKSRARGSRSTAAASASASEEDALYRLAGLRTPSESAARDLAGGLLAPAALEEVASRTGGRVVWVVAAAASSAAAHRPMPGGGFWADQFHQCGATVDLASDPLGWDGDGDIDGDGEDKRHQGEEASGSGDSKVGDDGPLIAHRHYPSRMDSLEAVLTTIERAAASIMASPAGEEGAVIEVPVIFDSIVPLLSFHGSAKTLRFVRRLLGRGISSRGSRDDPNTPDAIVISPVVLPILIESIRPADMRRFEDEADAFVTLSGGEMRTVRRGGGDGKVGGAAGRLGTDVQQFAMEQNQLHKQEGFGGSTEKLVLLKSSDQSGDGKSSTKKVVQRKTKASSTTERRAEDESLLPTAEKLGSMEISSPSAQAPSASSPSRRTRPTLQIREEGRGTHADSSAAVATTDPSQSQSTTSGPRIFVQDDDPEFDDMDEEDLDDDLDL